MDSSTFKLCGWPRELKEPEGRVLYALESYQIIETVLKAYLSRFAENQSDRNVADKYAQGKVLEWPLGQLLRAFKSVNANVDLHKKLEGIVKNRNEIAHQALVAQNPDAASLLGVNIMSIHKLREIDSRAMKAATAVVCEFMAHSPRSSDV